MSFYQYIQELFEGNRQKTLINDAIKDSGPNINKEEVLHSIKLTKVNPRKPNDPLRTNKNIKNITFDLKEKSWF